MKRVLSVAVAGVVLVAMTGAAFAWMGGGPMGAGMRGRMMGAGPMGGGPMGPGAGMACPGWAGAPTAGEPVTEDKAKALAQEYADTYLKGFTVEKVLPFTGGRGTAYSVELKGPNDEVRVLHVNPFGAVMPFGGPGRRAAR